MTDKEYRELYEKTEKARLEWEAAMLKFCQVKLLHGMVYLMFACKFTLSYKHNLGIYLQLIMLGFQTCEKLEEERITHLREMCSLYSNMLAAVIPQLQQVSINAPIFLRSFVSEAFYDDLSNFTMVL